MGVTHIRLSESGTPAYTKAVLSIDAGGVCKEGEGKASTFRVRLPLVIVQVAALLEDRMHREGQAAARPGGADGGDCGSGEAHRPRRQP